MFKPIFEKKVDEEIKYRKELGLFSSENIPCDCQFCGETINSAPAYCWGKRVDGFYERGQHEEHNCPKAPKVKEVEVETGLSTDVKDTADYVVFCQGTPCFINESERNQYIELVRKGVKVIVIRGYTFDRLYSMIPYSDWKENEERHKRKAETYVLLEDMPTKTDDSI
jgi:hypothetical protein